MKNIEHYFDYRAFLKDFYEEKKRTNAYFSYRYFSRQAGIGSPSRLREVIEGKRNLTEQTLPGFIHALGFGERDASFFTSLVKFNQAKTAREKSRHLEEMRHLLPPLSQKQVPIGYYAVYSKWYNIAIREIACAFDWGNDYARLAAMVRPAIKMTEAKAAVKLLMELGFLIKDKDGGYRQKDPIITTGPEVMSVSIRNLNHQFALLGAEAIHAFPPTERDISSLTIGISSSSYQLMKQEILGFRDRIKRIVANQNHMDSVYQLNIQLFPVGKGADA